MDELMELAYAMGGIGERLALHIYRPTARIRSTVDALLERVPLAWRPLPVADGTGYASITVSAAGATVTFVVSGLPQPAGWEPLPMDVWLDADKDAGELLRAGIVTGQLDLETVRMETLQ